ncbi:MAG: NrfD/PsrC family molybdoenzyme membrane anchor subunit [Chloroflexota bacterium]
MNTFPSSTFFSAPPEWGWYIVFYFFFGGLAGGCYFIAVLIDLFGGSDDRALARLGYYIALPCLIISAILLTLDLGRPLRFWHMLFQSNTYKIMFKPWSPMSVGSWALFVFGIFSLLSFLGALAEDGRLQKTAARNLRPPGALGSIIALVGGLFGFFVAGYTGVLLGVTNRPIWSDTSLLGMLFVVSAASISVALMILLAKKSDRAAAGINSLHRLDMWVVALEFVVLIAVMFSLGPVFRAWLNAWGALLFIGVIVVGMLIPWALYFRKEWLGDQNLTAAAASILVGGFILRLVIVFSAQRV